ncbi:MAG: 50S ribosomal protein L11 methyltransferase [Pseudolabrys sp.]|nr:50S ribosomal protein L11 methyltransferase [Pseudolabrys sp.]
MPPTILARLIADEATAKRVASIVAETLEDAVTAAVESVDGAWAAELHFAAPPDKTAIRELIASAAGHGHNLSFETVTERDWVAASLEGLRPVRAGRFLLHGAHDRAHVKPNDINIEIEAALAFGTGHHGTTRGCLLALDLVARRGRRRRTLDLGTGTGVLAIAAAKAFRSNILATDIDPVAVAAARSNAQLNHTGAFARVVQATGPRGVGGRYDLIFANILLGPLTRMATPLARLAAPGAVVILSGLLPSHANAARAAYGAQGLHLARRLDLEGWTTLIMTRPKRKPPRPRPRRFR